MTKDWRGRSLTWGKRLIIVAIIMTALIYGVLSLAQRSPDALRKGLEDYLSKATGHRGEITELAQARLVPDVVFDLKGVNIRDWEDGDKVYVHADGARIIIPFWRMMFGSARYAVLEINNLQIATGYFLPQKLSIGFAGITDPPPQTSAPQFIADGEYNKLPLLVTMEMIRKPTKKGPLYSFANNSLMTFKLGETEGEGIIARHFSSVSLESARLERGDMAAEFTAQNIEETPLNSKITGKIGDVPFNALLTEEGENIVLNITPEATNADGAVKIKRFVDAVMGDLGLSDKASKIRVVIAGIEPKASPAGTSKDSE
jgi:hypothetical protein